jgi:hypothetical protein
MPADSNRRQMSLGTMFKSAEFDCSCLVLGGGSLSSRITASNTEHGHWAAKAFIQRAVHQVSLQQLLEAAGILVVNRKPITGEYLDLSPEALDKTTLLKIVGAVQ